MYGKSQLPEKFQVGIWCGFRPEDLGIPSGSLRISDAGLFGAWCEKSISQSNIYCYNIEFLMRHLASYFYKI
jgi:hypothetical protein